MKLKTGFVAHGSPYDRGAADSYYRRPCCPHWYPEGTYKGERITREDMTDKQVEEYLMGYEENEALGDHKEW